METIIDIIKEIHAEGVELELTDEGSLSLNSQKEIDIALIERIKSKKEEILSFIKKNKNHLHQDKIYSKIDPDNRGLYQKYPISFYQKQMWFQDQLQGSLEYHLPKVLRLSGPLNNKMFSKVLQGLVARHEILRTVILSDEEEVYQEVLSDRLWQMDEEDLTLDSTGLDNVISSYVNRPFDLSSDYMLRACLCKLDQEDHILILVFHHIACDQWSSDIIEKELLEIFMSNMQERPADLIEMPLQYIDYAIWQKENITATVMSDQLLYWEKQLEGLKPLSLPTDYLRPSIRNTASSTVTLDLDTALTSSLQKLSKKEGVTLFVMMLSIWKILLSKYSNEKDICVGTVSTNRKQPELENMVGLFLSVLALRSTLDDNLSCKELIFQVKQTVLVAYKNQDVPFEKIIDRIVQTRESGITPLFQTTFSLDNSNTLEKPRKESIEGLNISIYGETERAVQYDLELYLTDKGSVISINAMYRNDLFRKDTIERMLVHYKQLMKNIVDKPDISIGALQMLTPLEENQILKKFNDTYVGYPKDKTIVDLFEDQVKRFPDHIAIVCGKKEVTYSQLNNKANQVAHYLSRHFSLDSDDLVGIMLGRSINAVATILGVLKSGAAYVTIDSAYPEDRKSFIINDTKLKALIVDLENMEPFTDIDVPIVYWNQSISKEVSKKPMLNAVLDRDLAYVIYTSGSTGQPKGVMVEHGGVKNTILAQIKQFAVDKKDHCLQFASHSFDASVSEIFIALLSGSRLYIVEDKIKSNVDLFTNYLAENSISVATIPPAFFRMLDLTKITSLKTLISAGEEAHWESAKAFSKIGQYFNAYGPTESSICATVFKGEVTTSIPIGRPIANTQVYILNDIQRMVPIGVVGELCIGGSGLARGYLNQEHLTKEKFIDHPFKAGERLYRTGDLAKWLSNGDIEFLGRKDDQIKIRGYRVEPGEIETLLNQHNDSHQFIVDKKGINGEETLIGYYKKNASVKLRPSLSEYFVYDDLAYHSLTTDDTRNNHYKKTFSRYVKGKVVLDIGTGPEAVLSQFCIEAGAKKVYAVEISKEVSKQATQRVEELGLKNKIEVIHGDIAQIELPELVDYCVSEIVGPIGGSEGAAKLINSSRSFLKKSQQMIPKRSLTKIAGVCLPDEMHNYHLDELSQHYMNNIFKQVGYEFDLRLCVENFPLTHVITNDAPFEDLDYTHEMSLEKKHDITLIMEKPSFITGFLVWLNLYIDDDIIIDTLSERYSWLPVYFPVFYDHVSVEKGDYIEATIERKLSDNGLNPDFMMSGKLHRKNDDDIPFRYSSSNHDKVYRSTPFYQALFDQKEKDKTSQVTFSNKMMMFLEKRVPDYMIPRVWIEVSEFSLTFNGKVDKKSLPKPQIKDLSRTNYAKPTNNVEDRLVHIWQDVLNIEQIGIHDNFFELGGNSILYIKLVSKINKIFGLEIGISTLFKFNTISKLSLKLIDNNLATPSILITFNDHGTQVPIFFAPPAGGNSLCYRDLSLSLDENQPFYAFQCPGLERDEKILGSVEELATAFINEMQKIDSMGPYRLGGFSLGGVIALEMAIQLENHGFSVEELIILDSYPLYDATDLGAISHKKQLSIFINNLNQVFKSNILLMDSDLEGKSEQQQTEMVVKLVQDSSLEMTENQVRRFIEIDKRHLALHYVPDSRKKLNVPITLFKTHEEQEEPHVPHNMDRFGWAKYTNKEVKLHMINCKHIELILNPQIQQIANIFNT